MSAGSDLRVQDYQREIAALAEAAARRDAELAATERAFQEGAAAATAELTRAGAAAGEADRRVRAAVTSVVNGDRAAAATWAQLRQRRGWRTGLPTELPAPAEVDPAIAARIQIQVLLDGTARRINRTRRGAPRAPLPHRLLPLLLLLGAGSAGTLALAAAGLLTLGQGHTTAQAVMRLAGWVAFGLAPLAGLPVAASYLERQFDSRLDLVATGMIVLGGFATGCTLLIAFVSGS